MKTQIDANKRCAQPTFLPSIADPEDAKIIFQLCILEAMLRCWEIFRHSLKQIAQESARTERITRKKKYDIHRLEILRDYIKLQEKIMSELNCEKLRMGK